MSSNAVQKLRALSTRALVGVAAIALGELAKRGAFEKHELAIMSLVPPMLDRIHAEEPSA